MRKLDWCKWSKCYTELIVTENIHIQAEPNVCNTTGHRSQNVEKFTICDSNTNSKWLGGPGPIDRRSVPRLILNSRRGSSQLLKTPLDSYIPTITYKIINNKNHSPLFNLQININNISKFRKMFL